MTLGPLVDELDAIRARVGVSPAGVPPWHHRTHFVTAVPPARWSDYGAVDADVLFTTVAYRRDRFETVPANVRVERPAAYRNAVACDAVVHHGSCDTTVAALSAACPPSSCRCSATSRTTRAPRSELGGGSPGQGTGRTGQKAHGAAGARGSGRTGQRAHGAAGARGSGSGGGAVMRRR